MSAPRRGKCTRVEGQKIKFHPRRSKNRSDKDRNLWFRSGFQASGTPLLTAVRYRFTGFGYNLLVHIARQFFLLILRINKLVSSGLAWIKPGE